MFNRADGTVTISLPLFPQPQTWRGSSGVPVKRTLTDNTSSGVSESVVSRWGGGGFSDERAPRTKNSSPCKTFWESGTFDCFSKHLPPPVMFKV